MNIILAILQLKKMGGKERDCIAIAHYLKTRGHSVEIVTTSTNATAITGCFATRLVAPAITNQARARAFAEASIVHRNRSANSVLLSFERIPGADFFYAADNPTPRRWIWTPRYRTRIALETGVFAGSAQTRIFFLTARQQDAYAAAHDFDPARCTILPLILHDDRYEADIHGDSGIIRRALGIPADAPLAVSIATNPRLKGIDRLLDALTLQPRLHLLIVGSRQRWLLHQIRALGLHERVHAVRYAAGIMRYISAADVLVHAARAEAAGQVIAEALLAGVPVVVSDACGYANHVGTAGIILSEPFGVDQLSAALATMIDQLPTFTMAAQKHSSQLFRQRGEWLKVIAEQIEQHGSPRVR